MRLSLRHVLALSFSLLFVPPLTLTVSSGLTGCSKVDLRVCACLAVWYNAECPSPDPMSTGWDDLGFPPGMGIEAAVVGLDCPSGGSLKDDAGKLTSVASSDLEKRTVDYIKKREGFLVDEKGELIKRYNQVTGRSSFIKVASCKEFSRSDLPDGAPLPSKDWFRYHAKQRPGMFPQQGTSGSGGGTTDWNYTDCENVEVVEAADGTADVFVYEDCPFHPIEDIEEVPAGMCDGTVGPTCPMTSTSSACDACAKTHCCGGYNSCFCGQAQCDWGGGALLPNGCSCRFECEALGAVDGCQTCATAFGDPNNDPKVMTMASCLKIECPDECPLFLNY